MNSARLLRLVPPPPPEPAPRPRPTRLAVVDGLRGASILVVALAHGLDLYPPILPMSPGNLFLGLVVNGALGVRFFFVVSGFIITSILMEERRRNGTVLLLDFYKRRFVRLVPALFVFLFALFTLSTLAGSAPSPTCALTAATFLQGIAFACDFNYSHLWSLTAEEVFYLFWPATLLLLARRPRGVTAAVVLSFLLCGGMRIGAYLHLAGRLPAWPFPTRSLNPIFHLDQMMVGAGLGYLLHTRRQATLQAFSPMPWLLRLLGAVLVYVPHLSAHYGKAPLLMLPFGVLIQALGMALILGSLLAAPRGLLHRILTSRALTFLGLISYSVYLWQQIFTPHSVLNPLGFGALTKLPVSLVPMFVLGWLSYRFVERPTQRLAVRLGFVRSPSSAGTTAG